MKRLLLACVAAATLVFTTGSAQAQIGYWPGNYSNYGFAGYRYPSFGYPSYPLASGPNYRFVFPGYSYGNPAYGYPGYTFRPRPYGLFTHGKQYKVMYPYVVP